MPHLDATLNGALKSPLLYFLSWLHSTSSTLVALPLRLRNSGQLSTE